jgi:regulator of protease activity HflC (stomatin/prohibitin superfamily)
MIGLLSEFGRFIKKLEPGLHAFNQCSQTIMIVDLKTQILNIPAQMLLTKDNVTVQVDAFVTYRLAVPELAVYKVRNYENLVNFMTQGVMKTIVAERTLSELLVNRNEIEKAITNIIDDKTDPYGIKVISIETRSINLPTSMERAMATVAESKKESEAKVIDAQGSLESAKIFRRAADELKGNPISLQLQYFETLKGIAAENNSTIIVPDSILSSLGK